jgi:hypothetical protein
LAQLTGPTLVEGEDDEGSPYFRSVLTLPDGRDVTLAEGHDRDSVKGKSDRVTEALKPDAL